jgi:hypothetical protein
MPVSFTTSTTSSNISKIYGATEIQTLTGYTITTGALQAKRCHQRH